MLERAKGSDILSNPDLIAIKILKFLGGIAVLVLTHLIGSVVANWVRSAASKDENGDTSTRNKENIRRTRRMAVETASRALYYLIMVVGIIVVLHMFGVEVASIIALIGTAGFILGMSLQGTLADLTSGIILAFFQTYQIGDIVNNGSVEGLVTDFRLINTVMRDLNTKATVSVPNSKMQGATVQNYTLHPYIVSEFTVQIANVYRDISGFVERLEKKVAEYPEVAKGTDVGVRVGVKGMKGWGSQLAVRVPIEPGTDLVEKRGMIFNRLRQMMATDDVPMLGRGSTNDDHEGEGDFGALPPVELEGDEEGAGYGDDWGY